MAAKSILKDLNQILAELRKGALRPVYCFFGPEHTLKSELVEAVRAAGLQDKAGQWNHDHLDAGSVDVSTVWNAVRTTPMFGRRRLVEVSNLERWNDANQDALADKLGEIPDSTCLLLVADSLDGRKKLVRACRKHGVALKLETLRTREAAVVLEQWCKASRIRLTPQAQGLLLELTGSDLGAMKMALQNASLYAGGEVVDAHHVAATVPDTRQALAFDLADAVAERSLDRALDTLRRLGHDTGSHLKALGMLARQIRLLRRAQAALARGVRPRDLAEALDVHPFVARKLAGQVKTHTPESLERAHRLVAEADLALKSSRRSGRLIMEGLVLALVASGGKEPAR